MSKFLLYFETANPSSTNYREFRDVGTFIIPEYILTAREKKRVIYNSKDYFAAYISDKSGQCCHNYFLKGFADEREALLGFIRKRLENDCIIANLVGYIEQNAPINTPVFINKLKSIDIESLESEFIWSNFNPNCGISIQRCE